MTKSLICQRLVIGAWSIVLFIAGCQRNSDVLVEGTVTYDGQLVEMGAISFVPTVAGEQSQGAAIANGKFSAMVRPGSKRVEIRASRPKKLNPRDPDAANMREDFIPAKFNSASTLTSEIVAGQENKLQFELQSK
jgi:hypothetical protein